MDARSTPTNHRPGSHVPILPPVRVILRKTYTQRLDDGRVRLGCSFVS